MLTLLLALSPAHAFCGTFVGGAGSNLTNHTSQVVMVREDNLTTLTLAADYQGSASDFAIVIPVPEVLDPADVRVVSADLIRRLDQYSTPRAVKYTCDDVFSSQQDYSVLTAGCAVGAGFGCASSGMALDSISAIGESADDSVTVENEFQVADYQIAVLSAEESGDLFGWLGRNGYALPEGGEAILQSYIDAGTYFMAVKVLTDPSSDAPTYLPPLQFSYEAESMSLPIRIGTISAEGQQEVIIYAITEQYDVGISNYPELRVDDECMFEGNLTDYYKEKLDTLTANQAGWIKEHSWDMGQSCDPCTGTDPFTVEEMGELGFAGADTGHYGSFLGHLTRLRVRYTAEQAKADLSLYETGQMGVAEQTRFIRYNEELEFLYPVCDVGFIEENPGQCFEEASCSAPKRPTSGSGIGLASLVGLGSFLALRRRG